MSKTENEHSVLAPFGVRSFRFQWPADLATSWAFEMEVLILGWYVLVESKSVMLLVVYGALQYVGALVSPLFGVAGDRVGYRRLFLLTRALYALLAVTLALFVAHDALTPVIVLCIAAITGVMKPSDAMMRFALIAQTVPPGQLIGALGISRITTDSARMVGALAGVGVFAALGFVPAYVLITCLYGLSFLLSMGVASIPRETPLDALEKNVAVKVTPLHDLCEGLRYVAGKPEIMGAFSLAFLVNVFAYPFFLGLLPYVANNIYASGQAGLGTLGASFALGSLIASVVVGTHRFSIGSARLMLLAGMGWFAIDFLFAVTTHMWVGVLLLVCAGFLQNMCLTPLAAVMLRGADHAYRGRVMGMRILAIWGLPLGLMISGPLIDHLGFATMASLYSIAGLLFTIGIAVFWRSNLWHGSAASNVH